MVTLRAAGAEFFVLRDVKRMKTAAKIGNKRPATDEPDSAVQPTTKKPKLDAAKPEDPAKVLTEEQRQQIAIKREAAIQKRRAKKPSVIAPLTKTEKGIFVFSFLHVNVNPLYVPRTTNDHSGHRHTCEYSSGLLPTYLCFR
jgi:hypothetical protein